MRLPVLLVSIVLLLASGGCQLAELGEPIIVSGVEKEFNIDLWENLGPDRRNLEIRVATLETGNCLNSTIDHRFSAFNNKIQISLRNVLQPQDCIPGAAPAQANISVGSLAPGYYELSLDLKNEVFNSGQLSVFSDRYMINFRSRNGIVLQRQELRRVPENAIWGYAIFSGNQGEAAVKEFLTELERLTKPAFLPQGYYGYFQVNAGNTPVSISSLPEGTTAQTFLYSFAEGEAEIKTLLKKYRDAGQESKLDIRLFTGGGEEW